MNRYALIDATGKVVNIVKWDGETAVDFGSGITAEPVTDAHMQAFAETVRAAMVIAPVSRAAGRLALHRAGLLEQAEALIAQADIEARIWYADAQQWERSHPVVVTMGQALGLTPEQIDQLFLEAAAS